MLLKLPDVTSRSQELKKFAKALQQARVDWEEKCKEKGTTENKTAHPLLIRMLKDGLEGAELGAGPKPGQSEFRVASLKLKFCQLFHTYASQALCGKSPDFALVGNAYGVSPYSIALPIEFSSQQDKRHT